MKSRPFKVLQLIEDHGVIGGAERVALDLTLRTPSDRISAALGIVSPSVLAEEAARLGLTTYPLNIISGNGLLQLLRSLRRLIREERIDLVHSHLLRMNSLNGLLALTTNVTTVASIHGLLPHELTPKAVWFARFSSWCTSRTVCVSAALRQEAIAAYGLPPDRVGAIPNGFDPGRLASGPASVVEALRNRLQLQADDLLACAVGNIKPVKGYRELIDAIWQLADEFPHLKLAIAGNDQHPEGKLLREQISARKLASRVTLLGSYDEIAALFSLSRIYLCSSLHEGFSLTTAEAMGFGLPVIVTASGGPAEIVGSSEFGLIVPPGSAEGLAGAIRTLLSQPDQMSAMAARGQQRARTLFQIDRMIAAHRELYLSLLSAK